MSNRKMSKYVDEKDAVFSQTANRYGVLNQFDKTSFDNGVILSREYIDPIVDYYINHVSSKCYEKISSFFRCVKLNRLIGSKDNSQHVDGQAVDLTINTITPKRLFNDIISGRIKDYEGQPLKHKIGQCILEYDWVHISFDKDIARKQFMLAHFNKDNVTYTIVNKEIN